METVYKTDQIHIISNKLKVQKKDVKNILDAYFGLLQYKLDNGQSVKVLGICHIVVNNTKQDYYDTLAYTATELSRALMLSKNIVLGVLNYLEELIIQDVRKFYTYVLRGLVKIQLIELDRNDFRLSLTKSTVYSNRGMRVHAINSFKRKVES